MHPDNLLGPSMESDTDMDHVEMFTNDLFAEEDMLSHNDTVTLTEESHSLNTPPLVDIAVHEPQPPVVDLSSDPEPGDQAKGCLEHNKGLQGQAEEESR